MTDCKRESFDSRDANDRHCRQSVASLLIVAAACTGLMVSQPALAQIPDLPGWNLVWNDEFDGPDVDTSAWELLNRRDSHNNEKQYYLPEQISIDDGHLRITATNEPLDGKLYRSGRMWTWQEWSYGRFEARADLPTTQGMWPAFWLNPRGVPWPTGGEIDVMENRGSQPLITSSAYHWGASVAQHQYVSEQYSATVNSIPVNFHDSFHTYAAEWEPGVIRYYVDDNLHMTVTESAAPIHATPKSIILNLAVGGDFGGDPNATTVFPQFLDIDYVRVWQRDSVSSVALVNPSFEGSGSGSLDGWTAFNDTGSNVAISTDAAFEGTHSVKLSGRSTGSFNWQGVHQGVSVTEGTPLRASVESLVRSADGIVGTDNYADLKLEFYSTFGGTHGSSDFLGETAFQLADGTSPEDEWMHHDFFATAPAGAVEARITLIFLQPSTQGGSVYLDSTLLEVFVPGDYNRNGIVDAGDYTIWRDTLGQPVASYSAADGNGNDVIDDGDYEVWKNNFGATMSSGIGIGSGISVPEPDSILVAAIGVWLGLGGLAPLRGRQQVSFHIADGSDCRVHEPLGSLFLATDWMSLLKKP